MPEFEPSLSAPIVAIDYRIADGFIEITRRGGAQHGMFSTRTHAVALADLHHVGLTVDGQPPGLAP